MLKRFLLLHALPILIAVLFTGALYLMVENLLFQNTIEKTITSTTQKTSGWYQNFSSNEASEAQFMASIAKKSQLTLFGSSEFNNSPYVSYNFIPDSLGKPALGVGHAYHQSLSILIELLAAHEYNENSKVCFFISTGWFADGTNPMAFTEFARPNFLSRITNNNNINQKYKEHIGKYISSKAQDFDGMSNAMTYLVNSSGVISQKLTSFKEQFNKTLKGTPVNYNFELKEDTESKAFTNYDKIATQLQEDFLSNSSNNDIYVNNNYFSNHLILEDGSIRSGSIYPVNLVENPELEDFKLLIQYIKERKMEASFVIIPLNPYFYSNITENNALLDTLTHLVEVNNYPLLNLYAKTKEEYEPGLLKDVMHFGDYGWMKVNKFLDSVYYE